MFHGILDEKSSQLSTVLQNLRSYQLATGDVSSAKLTLAREKFGEFSFDIIFVHCVTFR